MEAIESSPPGLYLQKQDRRNMEYISINHIIFDQIQLNT